MSTPRGESRLLAVLDIVEALWGMEAKAPHVGHDEPLDGLILTILSQNTNDRNRDVAYERLRESFPSWNDAAVVEVERIVEAIRPAGIAQVKAGRILEVLQRVRERFGTYSIAEMRGWDRATARTFLEGLPGVGVKTASCVLLFDLGMPAFPVDTHVARVSRRIGLVPPRLPERDISLVFERIVPTGRQQGGHLNLIEHGRNLCRARVPRCDGCAVRPLCDFGKEEMS